MSSFQILAVQEAARAICQAFLKKCKHLRVESGRPKHNASVPESLPQASNGFDWSEGDVAETLNADGMAVLAVVPQGVGYLGRSD